VPLLEGDNVNLATGTPSAIPICRSEPYMFHEMAVVGESGRAMTNLYPLKCVFGSKKVWRVAEFALSQLKTAGS
jgi:hypothetical protein